MGHKSILIAIDSSAEADEVVRTAKDIVGDSDAALSLITVIRPVGHAYGGAYGMMASSAAVNIEQEAVELAKENQSAIEKKFGIQCEKAVVIGQPAREIRHLAETSNTDLIVIGSHGPHGLGLILGSTANGVLHGAPCNVYVVRIRNE